MPDAYELIAGEEYFGDDEVGDEYFGDDYVGDDEVGDEYFGDEYVGDDEVGAALSDLIGDVEMGASRSRKRLPPRRPALLGRRRRRRSTKARSGRRRRGGRRALRAHRRRAPRWPRGWPHRRVGARRLRTGAARSLARRALGGHRPALSKAVGRAVATLGRPSKRPTKGAASNLSQPPLPGSALEARFSSRRRDARLAAARALRRT